MAEGVRLDLQVGLDTAYLRNQLNTIGTKLGGQTVTLPINFDKQSIAAKTQELQKYIANKTFKIKIESNTLDALVNKVKNFKDRLDELKNEDIELKIKTGAIVSLSKRDGAKITADLRAAVLGDKKKLLIPTSIKPSITRADVRDFTNAVKSKLSGLSVKVKADLEMGAVRGGAKSQAEIDAEVLRGYEAISRMGAERMKSGGVTEAARREQLKQRLSTGEFDISQLRDIGAQLGIKGVGRFRNTQNLIEKIVSEASVEMIKKYVDPQAVMRNPNRGPLQQVLDTFARGMFQMLGMDPAAMKEQARQKLLPPAINWPAQTPPPRPFTGPSSTGRALPPGAIPAALPGTSFASQKRLVGDVLSPSLKEALRGAANTFVDAVRAELNAAVRQVSVRDLGTTAQRALRGGVNAPIAGLLPAAGGTTPIGQMRFNAVRTGAFVGDQPFMRAPSVPTPLAGGGAGGGGGVPPRGGSGGFFQGMGGELRRGLGGLNLPGSGTIRELGNEFSEATKQVLLFGTAYKALAFGMAFPREVADAVSQLQSFRNTLEAISPTATEARLSNELILGLVERYNVPLESARQGFAKLYASMEPAGFSGKEISTLFTGISKASATLGLSQDKVDRVVYAFSQMASKGQLMSEEVSGQLGDVIPGALSIMAEAADMGIAEFKKAMEDGEFVGKRFAEVMNNVPTVLEERFGKGAEGASRTFQGAMNNMQNSLKLFYESFEPVAVVFLNNFVTPIAKGLKEASDGLNAFFTGAQAQTFGGEKIAAELNALKPAFQGIIANVQQLMPLVQLLGGAVLQAAKLFTALAGNPVVGFLVKTYAQALLLTTAFKILSANAIVQTIRSLVSMVVQLVATRQAMLSTQLQMALLTSNAGGLAAAFRSGALAAAGLGAAIKAALLGGVVTGAIVVIDLLIGRIQRLRAESNAVKAAGKGAQSEVKAAYAGGIETGRSAARSKEAEARSASRLSGIYRNLAAGKKISQGDYEFAKGLGADLPGVAKASGGGYAPMRTMLNEREPAVFSRTYERYSLQQAQRAENIRQGVAAGQRQGEEAAAAQLARDARSRQIADIETPSAGAAKPTKGTAARESRVPLLELELATAEQIMEIERQMMTARLSGNELEVIRLEGLKEQVKINEQIAKIKLDKQTPAEEKSLQIQKLLREGDQARLKTSFELEKKIAETLAQIRERTVGIKKAAEEELADKKKYDRLVAEGILPSVAKITVEVERQFAIEQEKLELLRKDIERQISLLEKQKEATKDAEKRLKIEKELAWLKKERDIVTGEIGTLPSMSAKTIQATVAAQAGKPVDYLQDAIDETTKNLERLTDARYQAVEAANAIGNAFGNAFKGLITGSMTAQEALGNMFQSIADSFADMVAQMIAEWIRMQILGIVKAFLGSLGGGGGDELNFADMAKYSGFANGGIAVGGFKAFASGGVVTGPTLGLVGEGRYNEAIVPLPDGKSIPVELNTSMFNATDQFAANRAAMNGSMAAQSAASPFEANRQAMMTAQSAIASKDAERTVDKVISASMQPMKINYETQVINNVEYVTSEQFQRGMNQAAEKGRALTMGALKNSVKARRQIGI